jgi:C-terminal processing protease CtpA/Prc
MIKMLLKMFGLASLWSAGAIAQQPVVPGADGPTQRYARALGAILSEEPARTSSVTIVGILDSTPAAVAGLSPGDTLLRVGGDDVVSIVGIIDALALVAPEANVEIVVRRAEQERTFILTVAR